ncbi:hypothetical protein BUALT_Bualt05G0143000 [Buddleja alternifolia]|uniref:X8 domain-containing protein n=1 Tax=Buddleja alternifolia TaxID=168488 RepID=A0AAV6XJ95_9LAMI|nr:hypothetical protein BUALT_Bualt05G0143000 [Buddleja alternifolia]
MAALVVGLVLLLSMAVHSDATYCVCNNGLDDRTLQKNIDYACGAAADCTAIHENGACYNPNTVRDHCNYAVNSYYQRRQQATGTCDFQGTATVTATAPSAASGCVYQSSPSSSGGSTSPGTNSTTGGTPNTGGTPTIGGTTTGTLPGSTTSGFGMGPTGSGLGGTDNSAAASLTQLPLTSTFMLVCFSSLPLLISSLM